MTDADYLKQFTDQGEIHKKVLYKESWDLNKFQAGKPNRSRSDWFFWVFEHPEMAQLRKNWETAMIHVADGIDDRYLTVISKRVKLLRPIHTKLFHLLDLD